ncbi:hypothetical protein Cpir12675_005245 [Ceratocystis pirilliformis]|uniref:Fe2OG dioxygenase domain-containing protein n=1 Tax=Ceratocystis pirilliformis TaxID=259994 RepID=A0ABR3YR44_9PEZI
MASSLANIPIIDITDDGLSEFDIGKALVDAAAEQGFIYIKNTGKVMPIDRIQKAFDISRILFKETSLDEKRRCTIQKNNRGWSDMQTEMLDPKTQKAGDTKEGFNFGEFKDGKPNQPIPSTIEPFEGDIKQIFGDCSSLAQRIIYLLGVGLETQPADFFSSVHTPEKGESGTTLRMLYYPAPSEVPVADKSVRAGAHSDYGSITLLFRLPGQAGLEILTRENTWAPVPVIPTGTETDPSPPILVNIGDLLSYWTNGLFRSTIHRVTIPSPATSDTTSPATVAGEAAGERYSVAFFCHPVSDTRLEPVPSTRVANFSGSTVDDNVNPYAQRKVMTANEHLFMRLRASYKDLYGSEKTPRQGPMV